MGEALGEDHKASFRGAHRQGNFQFYFSTSRGTKREPMAILVDQLSQLMPKSSGHRTKQLKLLDKN